MNSESICSTYGWETLKSKDNFVKMLPPASSSQGMKNKSYLLNPLFSFIAFYMNANLTNDAISIL
jgi:hypothetical protein